MTLRQCLKNYWPVLYVYRKVYYAPKDISAAFGFIFHRTASPTTFGQRLKLVCAFYRISYFVDCPHTEHELLAISRILLDLGSNVPGIVVEAGAFHGGSTAKLSRVAALCGRKLEVFDSFEGMPENIEEHGKSIYGREHHFPMGSHAVSLDEVRHNISRFGVIGACRFHKGWFKNTMPLLKEPVALACMNGDLVQSTEDCLHALVPLMSRGGVIFSQDAHFPWIIKLLEDKLFWKDELGIEKPRMDALGTSKLIGIYVR